MGAITMTVRAYYLAFCNLIQQFLFTVMVTQVGDVSYFVISYVVKVHDLRRVLHAAVIARHVFDSVNQLCEGFILLCRSLSFLRGYSALVSFVERPIN